MGEFIERVIKPMEQELAELEALPNRTAEEEQDRRELIVALYDARREEAHVQAAWDRGHAEAMDDATGQDLDTFLGEG